MDALGDPASVAVVSLAVSFVIVAGLVAVAAGIERPARRIVSNHPAGDNRASQDRDGNTAVGFGSLAAFTLLIAGVALFGPMIVAPAGFAAYVRSVLRRRGSVRERERQIRNGLAEVVDLFAVALASGHNLYAATGRVAQWSSDPFSRALAACIAAVDDGQPLSDSLDKLPSELGSAVRPLISALVAHDRYGAPIAHNLAALASESRRARRHHAELVARRLPVMLLGPLVVCVLPAFLLLTVVPLVAETVGWFAESFGA